MKKIILLGIGIAGWALGANAQTLLYEWNFTNNASTTVTAPSYAWQPGTGGMRIQDAEGSGSSGVNCYFTNGPTVGPGSGAGRLRTWRDLYAGARLSRLWKRQCLRHLRDQLEFGFPVQMDDHLLATVWQRRGHRQRRRSLRR